MPKKRGRTVIFEGNVVATAAAATTTTTTLILKYFGRYGCNISNA